jgi:hypothetical protein
MQIPDYHSIKFFMLKWKKKFIQGTAKPQFAIAYISINKS